MFFTKPCNSNVMRWGTVWNNTKFQLFVKEFRNTMLAWWSISVKPANLLRWRHKMQIPLLITWFLDTFTKVHFACVSLEYHIWAFTYHEVFIHLNSQFYVNRKDPQWQWKQIVSQPSFHSISLSVNERIFFSR